MPVLVSTKSFTDDVDHVTVRRLPAATAGEQLSTKPSSRHLPTSVYRDAARLIVELCIPLAVRALWSSGAEVTAPPNQG